MRHLLVAVIVLELLLALMIEVVLWTGTSQDPWWQGGRWTFVAVLAVPPA